MCQEQEAGRGWDPSSLASGLGSLWIGRANGVSWLQPHCRAHSAQQPSPLTGVTFPKVTLV